MILNTKFLCPKQYQIKLSFNRFFKSNCKNLVIFYIKFSIPNLEELQMIVA
jgi:hypothetical protein